MFTWREWLGYLMLGGATWLIGYVYGGRNAWDEGYRYGRQVMYQMCKGQPLTDEKLFDLLPDIEYATLRTKTNPPNLKVVK